MIEWKDVNKELPKEDCDVILYVSGYSMSHILFGQFKKGDGIFFSDTILCYSVIAPYLTISFTYDISSETFTNGGLPNSITHWAYINEPKGE